MVEGDIRVAELFAGVGGFRLGLEYSGRARKWPRPRVDGFEVIWSNQREPDEGKQWASKIYTKWFGSEGHEGGDIHEFTKTKADTYAIPEHDLLVGGFPCQDYSVARTISGEKGIHGEKGKLWTPIWQIIKRIHMNEAQERPKMILLENVPRLLNSPADARGLNFSVILKRLLEMGYEVEWRVVNASDYGMPQQRRRVFILAYRTPGSGEHTRKINGPKHFGLNGPNRKMRNPMEWWMFGDADLEHESGWEVGPFARAFPAEPDPDSRKRRELRFDNLTSKSSEFGNAGYAWVGSMGEKDEIRRSVKQYCSWKAKPIKEEPRTIRDIMLTEHKPEYELDADSEDFRKYKYVKDDLKEFRIRKEDKEKAELIIERGGNLWEIYQRCTRGYKKSMWRYHKATFEKHLESGLVYRYQGGAMAFPDDLDNPSRTVVTAEIGKAPSRMRHVIKLDDGTHRRLMPVELERLNEFPDNWTKIDDIKDSRRGFLMGNALVVGVVARLRGALLKRFDS